ncbi:MAG: carboxylating nicotinate-nucleotide diphosphorylase [Mobiluncus porci]|uniref:carboxylating nicotinate-nucleotide diphosphorylase n=1 Tax=Mobiluncus TaxID=2050 RepID=UPI0023F28B20|nr:MULTISPECIES: carboxylating nicotinate-nucleotide diphosphorylase [Mobiluncus]MCI6585464.1 carboxylating nicotinate-nucleotide diphosphorylase [Mobiluncus sp.]MDD7541327.1 carboxylating nicotinate-nucleotide diphosphorylase [Mobiluncus porci]MDY5747810.1 carboxylating nicotinate-nucleotide diphosphorylase [Mobiluncus porci]
MSKLTIPGEIVGSIEEAGLNVNKVVKVIRRALKEDLAYGPDATTDAIFDPAIMVNAKMVARAEGRIAGVPVAAAVPFVLANLQETVAEITVSILKTDGERVERGDVILDITAPARIMLTAERTLLNLASQLSGVATHTAKFVDAIAAVPGGTKTRVRDTRKTIPGLRVLQKYAVRCGGGMNHRMGLGDAALIKDNHIAAAGSLTTAVAAVRSGFPSLPLEVECDTLEQVREATDLGVHLVLLDNMSPDMMREAVAITAPEGVKTEASGGLTLQDAAAVAATGVDFISIGALTHSSPILDLALDM